MSVRRLLVTALLLVTLLLGAAGLAFAVNPQDYYSFRVSSSLPGMLFGVTPEGQTGFGGAFQQNIPVAFTPCEGNWAAGYNSGSTSSTIRLGFSGRNVNGTAFIGRGWLTPGHGLYVVWEATSDKIEEAWNLQYQVLPLTETHPAVAVGVQDIFNERERFIGHNPHNARSLYVTATGPISREAERPIYWTAGWGNGRFRRGFVGLSAPLDDHWKLVGEYDSFNPNLGLAWGLNGADTARKFDVLGYFGYTDLKRPVLGISFTFRDL